MSSREHAQSPLALRVPWPRTEQAYPDDPPSLPLPTGRKSVFLVDGTSHVGKRVNVSGDPFHGQFPLWTERGSPGWSSMRPGRKSLESEEMDISCWEALHQVRATAPEHLGQAGPGSPLWKHLAVPP